VGKSSPIPANAARPTRHATNHIFAVVVFFGNLTFAVRRLLPLFSTEQAGLMTGR
jgi:hypothetical protein